MDKDGGRHEVLPLFATITSEILRIEAFESDLPAELLHVRGSIASIENTDVPLPPSRLDQAVLPARRLAAALRDWIPDMEPARRAAVTARVMNGATILDSTLDVLPMILSRAASQELTRNPASEEVLSFKQLADDYAHDARRDSLAATVLYCLFLGEVALAAAGSIWAATTAVRGSTFSGYEFLARGSFAVVVMIGAILTIWQADRHRRSGAEHRRLARQWHTFPSFINSISSSGVRDLMRGSLAPRFFPRVIDDDDALRDPRWPTAEELTPFIEIAKEPERQSRGWLRLFWARVAGTLAPPTDASVTR